MYAFTLEKPTTLADAAKLAAAGAKPLAGGQTLLASMKLRLSAPEQLADLGGIKELAGIKKDGNTLVIGAMTRHADVGNNADVKAAYPALAWLADHIGDRQVRAMGTIGGSLANNDPAACYPSAVLASGATVVTNQREIAADDFFQGLFTTALQDGELITAVRFPIPKRAAYEKLRQKASQLPAGGRVRRAVRQRRARRGHGRRQRRVPAQGARGCARQELHAPKPRRASRSMRATSTATCMPRPPTAPT